jgi:hypothetical protein
MLLIIVLYVRRRPGQNRVTWKTPSSRAFVPLQEPVVVLATVTRQCRKIDINRHAATLCKNSTFWHLMNLHIFQLYFLQNTLIKYCRWQNKNVLATLYCFVILYIRLFIVFKVIYFN